MTVEQLDDVPEEDIFDSDGLGNDLEGIDELPIVEAGSLEDFTKYEGLPVKIANVRMFDRINYFSGPADMSGKPTFNKNSSEIKRVIEIETEPLFKMDKNGQLTNELLTITKNNKQSNITARAEFNLTKKVDDHGKEIWVISKAPSAKLWKFMRKMGVNKLMELKGKIVRLTTVPDRDPASDKRWLRIVGV